MAQPTLISFGASSTEEFQCPQVVCLA